MLPGTLDENDLAHMVAFCNCPLVDKAIKAIRFPLNMADIQREMEIPPVSDPRAPAASVPCERSILNQPPGVATFPITSCPEGDGKMRRAIRLTIIAMLFVSAVVVPFRCAWVARVAQARVLASDDLALYCIRHELTLPMNWAAVSQWLKSEGYSGYGDGTAWLQETMALPWGESLNRVHPTSVIIRVRGGRSSDNEDALNTMFRRGLLRYRPAVLTNRCLWIDGVD